MKALRHQHGKQPQEFDVLKKHKDGTVDLGLNGELVIGNCVVAEEAAPGTCTLVSDGKKRPSKAELAAAQKAAAEAREAATAARAESDADPENEELSQKAENLEAVAAEAEAALY